MSSAPESSRHGPILSASGTMPVGFASHGAPILATDAVSGAEFAAWAATMARPKAILVVSAHWRQAPPQLGATATPSTIHDFHRWPKELYDLRYPAPGAPDLARDLLDAVPGLTKNESRGWDHGVWVPLLHMYPDADVPVLELSLPHGWSYARLFEFGQRLAPLRQQGVLVLGSGGAVHNLGAMDGRDDAGPESWATEFDHWLETRLRAHDVDALLNAWDRAPGFHLAHPTDEHFAPLLVALGAAGQSPSASFPIEGFELGSLGRRCIDWRG